MALIAFSAGTKEAVDDLTAKTILWSFNQKLKGYCLEAGVPYFSSHKIRFWSVTAQAKAGADLDTLKYNSGHKCKSTTLHYIRRANTESVNRELWGTVFS
ncbi:MAG: hypothetical protein K5697_00050 [Lachnospiraceae bacterium]|nr:hypothetical protein [Lachnospiraceae bacterium]